MGGAVTTTITEDQAVSSSKKRIALIMSCNEIHVGYDRFPVFPFEDIQEMLALCIHSWHRVSEAERMKQFQIGVLNELLTLPPELAGRITGGLGQGKRLQPTGVISAPFKFCIKVKRNSELNFKQKLLMLGRDHARIGITSDIISTFTQILLKSFAACVCDWPDQEAIMFAWTANMKYISTNMMATSFSLMRAISDSTDESTSGSRLIRVNSSGSLRKSNRSKKKQQEAPSIITEEGYELDSLSSQVKVSECEHHANVNGTELEGIDSSVGTIEVCDGVIATIDVALRTKLNDDISTAILRENVRQKYVNIQ